VLGSDDSPTEWPRCAFRVATRPCSRRAHHRCPGTSAAEGRPVPRWRATSSSEDGCNDSWERCEWSCGLGVPRPPLGWSKHGLPDTCSGDMGASVSLGVRSRSACASSRLSARLRTRVLIGGLHRHVDSASRCDATGRRPVGAGHGRRAASGTTFDGASWRWTPQLMPVRTGFGRSTGRSGCSRAGRVPTPRSTGGLGLGQLSSASRALSVDEVSSHVHRLFAGSEPNRWTRRLRRLHARGVPQEGS
jgi:hypothetical protein